MSATFDAESVNPFRHLYAAQEGKETHLTPADRAGLCDCSATGCEWMRARGSCPVVSEARRKAREAAVGEERARMDALMRPLAWIAFGFGVLTLLRFLPWFAAFVGAR